MPMRYLTRGKLLKPSPEEVLILKVLKQFSKLNELALKYLLLSNIEDR